MLVRNCCGLLAVMGGSAWRLFCGQRGLGMKIRKNSGKTPETLSEFCLNLPSRVRLGSPNPYHSSHCRAVPEFSPPSTAADVFFFHEWFRRGPLRAGHGIPSSTGGISETCRACPMFAVRTVFGRFSSSSGQKFRDVVVVVVVLLLLLLLLVVVVVSVGCCCFVVVFVVVGCCCCCFCWLLLLWLLLLCCCCC